MGFGLFCITIPLIIVFRASRVDFLECWLGRVSPGGCSDVFLL